MCLQNLMRFVTKRIEERLLLSMFSRRYRFKSLLLCASFTKQKKKHKDVNFEMKQVLGFGEYIEEVYAAYEQHKYETMVIILLLILGR